MAKTSKEARMAAREARKVARQKRRELHSIRMKTAMAEHRAFMNEYIEHQGQLAEMAHPLAKKLRLSESTEEILRVAKEYFLPKDSPDKPQD